MLDLAVPLAKDVLSKLATKATSSISDRFERKLIGQGSVRAGRGLTLFISNEDMGGFFKIVESLEKSSFFQKKNWWCHWNDKTQNKKTRRWISSC